MLGVVDAEELPAVIVVERNSVRYEGIDILGIAHSFCPCPYRPGNNLEQRGVLVLSPSVSKRNLR